MAIIFAILPEMVAADIMFGKTFTSSRWSFRPSSQFRDLLGMTYIGSLHRKSRHGLSDDGETSSETG